MSALHAYALLEPEPYRNVIGRHLDGSWGVFGWVGAPLRGLKSETRAGLIQAAAARGYTHHDVAHRSSPYGRLVRTEEVDNGETA